MRWNCLLQIERLRIVSFQNKWFNMIVTLIASRSDKSANSTELQIRMEQLSEQLNLLEEDKRKLTQEKDDLQQQLIKQKDRMLEAEQDAGYFSLDSGLIDSRLKSSLAAMEGEAGGQAKGEAMQLQKSIRDLTTESKFKDAEIQKLRDVHSLLCTTNY
jgi:chromosome segregation ATPase